MYATYKHLLGLQYTSGNQDCYGLARRYYKDLFNLEMTNFARPEQWWNDQSMNLLTDNLFEDGWEDVGKNLRNLRIGDGLIFSLISSRANHIGIYVGNGMFIHHIYQQMSREEPMVPKWLSRCLTVVRHPEVTKFLKTQVKQVDLQELLNGRK